MYIVHLYYLGGLKNLVFKIWFYKHKLILVKVH